MKSIADSWVDCSNAYYNRMSNKVSFLYDAFDEADKAIRTVCAADDLGSLSISLTYNDIEELNEKRRKLVSFCNAIHYEISELVDNPFSVRVASVLESAYNLSPENFKIRVGTTSRWGTMTDLGALVASTMTDIQLKADFDNRVKLLNRDVISKTLKDAVTEARYWEAEFQKSKVCQKIAEEVFSLNVQNNWATMTDMQREAIVTDYAIQIGMVMKEGRGWWDKRWGISKTLISTVAFDAEGFGTERGNGKIGINAAFVDNPQKNFSVDKVIDTITHEVRHAYQREAKANPELYRVPQSLLNEWNEPYISASDDYYGYYRQSLECDARAFAALSRP